MKIAIVSGHTLSGPAEGTVAIKSEALESRKITAKLLEMCKGDTATTITDCSVDTSDSELDYVSEVSDKVNKTNSDICIFVEFGHSDYHTMSGSDIYSNVQNMEEALLLINYMQLFGYSTSYNDIQSKFMDTIKTSKIIIFKACCIDSWKDMEKYTVQLIADVLYSSLLKKTPGGNKWKIEIDGSRRFFDGTNVPLTGVQKVDGVPYYFDEKGFVQFGFIKLGDMDWMYADPKTGRLYQNEWIMNYMQIYYADDDYKIALPDPANKDHLATRTIDGITYTFDKNGCIENEKYRINGSSTISFYFAENGKVYPYIWGLDTGKTVYDPIVK